MLAMRHRRTRKAPVPVSAPVVLHVADPDGVLPALTAHGKPGKHSRWPAIAAGTLIVLVATGLAAYAAAASYESVSALAAEHHVPLARLNPAGIDGGLFGVILIDIVLTAMGQPLGWLRMAARLFAAGTIAANFTAGWPDPAGIGLRIAAPFLFVILTEVARAVLLRRLKARSGEQKTRRRDRDKIPLGRWVLAFRPTFRLWKRMNLWGIKSYREALAMEMRRQRAAQSLATHYKTRDWRALAPSDLVWMLDGGLFMDDALAQVQAIVTAPVQGDAPGSGSGPSRPKSSRRRSRPKPARGRVPERPAGADLDTEAEALRILGAEPKISGGELGRRLGKSESYGCRLKNKLAPAGTK